MTAAERDLIAELENTAGNLRRLAAHLSDHSLHGLARACSTGAADCAAAVAKARLTAGASSASTPDARQAPGTNQP